MYYQPSKERYEEGIKMMQGGDKKEVSQALYGPPSISMIQKGCVAMKEECTISSSASLKRISTRRRGGCSSDMRRTYSSTRA